MRVLIALAALLLTSCENWDDTFPSDIGRARNAVRSKLKDPKSAEFKNLHVCPDSSEVWSGEVNAKNGFGAYSGFELFYVKRRVAAFYSDVSFDDFMRECYKADKSIQDLMSQIPSDIERIQGK